MKMRPMHHVLRYFAGMALALCLVLAHRTLSADTLTGEVEGRVLDLQGGFALSETLVTLKNVERGWMREVTTLQDGTFHFIQLEPGSYTVTAARDGYVTRTTSDVLVRLNQPKVIIPPFQLRLVAPRILQTISAVTEQIKTLAIDLTVPGPPASSVASLFNQSETSMLSLEDAALRWNFDARLLSTLPLRNGRSFDQLAFFAPGVTRVPAGSSDGPGIGIGVGMPGEFSVNGFRGRSNNFTVDGSDNNDEDIGVRRQGFVAAVPQSIESIEEFQILTGGYPAEFGRSAGSMVNAVTRAGENQVHGSVYGLLRDDRLSARGPFDLPFADRVNSGDLNGGKFDSPDETHKTYGGVLGGPINSKLFYFISGERQQNRGVQTRDFVVPAAGERGLRIQDGFVPIDQLGQFFNERFIPYSDLAGRGVFSLYPLPNNDGGAFGSHTYSQAKGWSNSANTGSVKLNVYPSGRLSFSGRYNITDDKSLVPFTGDSIHSSVATRTRTQNLSLFLNTIGSVSHAVRFSYGRTRLGFPAGKGSPLLFGSSPSTLPSGVTGTLPQAFASVITTPYGSYGPFGATGPIGQLAIVPYSTVGVDVFNFPQGRVDNTFQAGDLLTKTGAKHTLRFGFEVRRSQLNSFMDRNSRPFLVFGYGDVAPVCLVDPLCPFATGDGILRGTDLAALGAHAGLLQSISTQPAPDSTLGLRLLQGDLFVQEDWKVRRNLTLNIGARYQLQHVPNEVHGRIEKTLNPSADTFTRLLPTGTPLNQQIIQSSNNAFDRALAGLNGVIGGRSGIYSPERNDIAPRIGFAWDPAGNGHTVLRGGFGLTYDANLGAFISQSRNVFPSFVPVNLDLNFSPAPPSGFFINSANLFDFTPAGAPLIRPNTLNTFNLPQMFATAIGAMFVQGIPSTNGNIGSNGLAFTLPEKNLKTGYGEHMVLSLEHQFGNDLMISAGYAGTRGVHLPRSATPNGGMISTPVLISSFSIPLLVRDQPPFQLSPAGKRPIPSLGAFTILEDSASSTFHSLQVSAERRLRNGWQFRSSWTWSHAIDDVSDLFDGRAFFALPQDAADRSDERSSSNFDTRHRIAAYGVWEVPDFLDSVWSRRWKLALTTEFQTGQPYSINTAMDRNGDGNLTDRLDNTSLIRTQPGTSQPIRAAAGSSISMLAPDGQDGRVGRNTFRADHLTNTDVAISRLVRFSENIFTELRLEAFNVFNTHNFGIPIRILESPGFGQTFDTQTRPRELRIAVKLSF